MPCGTRAIHIPLAVIKKKFMKKLILGIVLLCSIKLNAQPAGYGFGKQVLIQSSQVSGSTALVDFPVLISFTDADLATTANGGNVENTNGYDIIFTLGDCATLLDHEIEKYDATTGEYIAWVRIPSLPATTDFGIHMYYGNSGITTDPSTTNTWNNGYFGVWHMSEDPSGTAPQIIDHTSGTTNGTSGGAMTSGDLVTGKVVDAIDFDGSNDVAEMTDAQSYANGGDFSVECWINSSDAGTKNNAFITNYGGTGQTPFFMLGFDNTNAFFWCRNTSGVSRKPTIAKASVLDGAWHHFVGVRSSTGTFLYLDGTLVNTQAASTGDVSFGTTLSIMDHFNRYTSGLIDEIRISSTARSTEWITTEYNNQNSPSTFYAVSAEFTANLLCTTLPIDLISFEAEPQLNNTVECNWQTASEQNNDFFTIERSRNGFDWTAIKEIKGAGNSSTLLSYTSIDSKPYPGISYYRLKQTDFDGQFNHSQIRSVNFNNYSDNQVQIYPIPATNQIIIKGNESELKQLKIYNALGQDVTSLTKQISGGGSKLVIDLSNLNTGIYYIKTKTTANKVYKQ